MVRFFWISCLVGFCPKILEAFIVLLPYSESISKSTLFREGISSLYSSPSSSYNPNDHETPEERQARMEMVRKIQASFYTDNHDSSSSSRHPQDEEQAAAWLQRDPKDPTILRNLPLWRVQWTELPGFQNVLNVHVPHYTHMFRKLLLQHPKPWYFGHVYLPGGSENLGNPDYYFWTEGEEEEIMYLDENEWLRRQTITTTGTLMQVTDYVEQDDGRLTLIVQGVGRIKVLEANQQVPYAVASKVQLLSDRECWEECVEINVGAAPMDFELSTAILESAKAVSVKESELWRDVEFYQTTFDTEKTPKGMVIKGGVSPLSNANGTVPVDIAQISEQLEETFRMRLAVAADECGLDEVLLAGSTMRLPDSNMPASVWEQQVLDSEQEVWLHLDEMIRLLGKAQPGMRLPVPAQLLGLLPTDVDWLEGFRLQEYAEQLEDNQARIGTFSKSPFVRLSKVYPDFPPMLRASRLSFAVWVLLESVVPVDTQSVGRQNLIETDLLTQRLEKAVQQLKTLNNIVQGMIEDS